MTSAPTSSSVEVDHEAGEPAEAAQLTKGDFNEAPPRWSPDGKKLAFASARHATRDRDNASDIWVLDVPPAGGKGAPGQPRRLTKTLGPASAPAWSPDGKQIAYLGHTHRRRSSGRHNQAWLVPAAGGEPRRLSEGIDRNCNSGVEPFWSKDGRSVLFGVMDGGNSHVYTAPAARGTPKPC